MACWGRSQATGRQSEQRQGEQRTERRTAKGKGGYNTQYLTAVAFGLSEGSERFKPGRIWTRPKTFCVIHSLKGPNPIRSRQKYDIITLRPALVVILRLIAFVTMDKIVIR